jgi:hypothetical protein
MGFPIVDSRFWISDFGSNRDRQDEQDENAVGFFLS